MGVIELRMACILATFIEEMPACVMALLKATGSLSIIGRMPPML